jgi:hypothetical protein
MTVPAYGVNQREGHQIKGISSLDPVCKMEGMGYIKMQNLVWARSTGGVSSMGLIWYLGSDIWKIKPVRGLEAWCQLVQGVAVGQPSKRVRGAGQIQWQFLGLYGVKGRKEGQ